MGVGGISIWQLLIILVIVVLLFGTKRLKNIGSDLGEAIRGFRGSMAKSDHDDEESGDPASLTQAGEKRTTESPTQARPADRDRT
ncbi:twin-arginine translocase TatA/TatE family subunit [Thiocystis violacea]|uniref:twin-arginine translocase TatA/TatE family subunit n=1 Tax=Thiocystis violacea TaxID=13725 RepID=UPI00190491F7|nr:twin-arginine translocase subunit TatA [Thiocystis violacea]